MDRLPSFKSFANSSLTAAMANFTGHDHTFAANCSSEDTASNEFTTGSTNVHTQAASATVATCPPYSNTQDRGEEENHGRRSRHHTANNDRTDGNDVDDQEPNQPNQVEEVQPPTNHSTSSDNLTHQQSKNSILTIAEGDDDEDMDACHGSPNNLLEPEVDLIEEQSNDAHPFTCGSSPEQQLHQKHRSAIKQPNVLRRVSGNNQQASSATSNQSNHHHRTGTGSGGGSCGVGGGGHGSHHLTQQQGCSSENGTGGILKSTLERGLKDTDDLNEPDEAEIFDSFADERRGCRSLICDTNGIIVAEMVYRCIICAFITESIADAQVHYHRKHMRKSQSFTGNTSTTKSAERCSNATPKVRTSRNKTISSNSNYINQQNMSQQTIYSSSPDVSHPTSPTTGNNSPSLHMDEMMDIETDDLDNFSEPDTGISGQHNSLDPFGNDPKPKGKFVFSPSPADYVPGRNAIIKQNGSSTAACHAGPPSGGPPTSVRGGYVTCAVCSITKYYASVQRRYGQFTCMGCAKFFGRFLIKPRRYYCTSLGSCPLDLSPRCKACLLLACINTYNIDEKRMRIVNANKPLNKSSNSSSRSSNESASGTANGGQTTGAGGSGGGTSVLSSSTSNQVNNSSLSFAPPPLVGKSQLNCPNVNERNQLSGTDSSATSGGANTGGNERGDGGRGGTIKGSTLPLTSRPTGNNSSTPSTVGRKGTGCRQCANCLADDCGKCNYCLDKPKFGGPNTLKKKCIQKKCLLIQPNTAVRSRSTAPASGLKDNNSISNTKSYVSHVR